MIYGKKYFKQMKLEEDYNLEEQLKIFIDELKEKFPEIDITY